MKNISIILSAIFSGVLLIGCAQTQNQFGGEQTTANVRFVSYINEPATMAVRDSAACPVFKRAALSTVADFSITRPRRLDMPGAVDAGAKHYDEVVIPADRLALIAVGSDQTAMQYVPGYSCSLGMAFQPVAGANYELQYKVSTNQCTAEIYEIKKAADGSFAKIPLQGIKRFRARTTDNLCSFR